MARFLLPILALPILLLSPPAAAQGFDLFGPPGVGLARLADADGSGDVSGDERTAFLATFEERADGTLDRGAVLARCVVGGLDVDGDGAVTGDDVEAALASLDTNGDGAISAAEAEPVNGAAATGFGAARWLMAGIAFSVADEDLSKDVSAAEWDAFRPTAPAGAALDMGLLAEWTIVAQRNVPEVRSAFTPSILLATLGASLDADRNGSLSRADLDGLMLAMDADGNGALSADELRPQRGGGGRGGDRQRGWEISDEVAALPPGMPWQRNLADALAMVRRTGKPLLICVNMDGEPASDNLAAGRYKDPAFLELARGFVTVVASPDRHTTRDYDDRGVRMPCERFGTLVEQEHIDIEPDLFERYFNGQRVAPRHVGVSPEGEILFDLFLLNDFTVIDAALREHGFFEAEEVDYAQVPVGELLDVPDAAARELLEALMANGEERERIGLAGLALDGRRQTQHPELVRLGLRDESQAVRRVTLDTMIREADSLPLNLAPEAFSVADGATRSRLVDALARRAASAARDEDKVRARRLARIYAASSAGAAIDAARWRVALAGGAGASGPAVASTPDARLDALARLESMLTDHPDDADLNALRAATLLAQARFLITNGGGNPTFFLEDARLGAERALELDPGHALAGATLAGACWFLSDAPAAGDAAARALPGLLGFAGSPVAAETLGYLSQARTRQLYEALGNEPEWPAAWVDEALAAHEILLAHPLGTEAQALAGLQLLGNLELNSAQRAFASRVLERFPTSGDAHNWFRFVFLRDLGAEGLVEAYDDLRVPAEAEANGLWYAGFGRLLAGDRLVSEGRGGAARDAYAGAADDLLRSSELEPSFEASVVHYLGMVHAGAARACLDGGDLDGALEALRASLAANPDGAAIENGLGETPAAVARELAAAFLGAGEPDAARAVEELFEAGQDR